MKKYQRLAQQIVEQIELGVWRPGEKLPSLREQVASSGLSFMTVGHAYQLLESQGRDCAPAVGLFCRADARHDTRACAAGNARRSGGYQHLYI